MKKFILMALISLVVASGFLFYPLFTADDKALAEEDGRIIKIESPGDPKAGIVISPPELEIEKQMIVIWLNLIHGKEINILFDEPETVISATSDPMGFTPEEGGGFSARYMPHIATASLRFTKSGTYSYTVTQTKSDPKTTTGKIIVR
jgi:hypothetical protein